MDKITLRKVQLAQLEIAKEIKRVCEENDIGYFLESGTLLGAIRHGGFIPWDDDMDIGMKRSNYEKFLKIAPEKLGNKFEILDWKTNKGYGFPFCKVINKNTEYIEKKAQKVEYHQGIYVDIFPYDIFPLKLIDRIRQKFVLTILKVVIRNKCNIKTWEKEKGINYFKLLKNIPFFIMSRFISKQVMVNYYDKWAQKYNDEEEYNDYFSQGIEAYGSFIFPKEVIEQSEFHDFEGVKFMCPYSSEVYLNRAYGDYMKLPPEAERENRHMIVKVVFENEEDENV